MSVNKPINDANKRKAGEDGKSNSSSSVIESFIDNVQFGENSTANVEAAKFENIEKSILSLKISSKKARELITTAIQNGRNADCIAAWIEKARFKNNPAAYFIALVRDNAELNDPQTRYKSSPAFSTGNVEYISQTDLETDRDAEQEADETEETEISSVDPALSSALAFSLKELTNNRNVAAWAVSFKNGKATVRVIGMDKPDPTRWLPYVQRRYPLIQELEIL